MTTYLNTQPHLLKGITFGLTAAFIWSMFPVVTRLSIDNSLSIWDIIALRFIVAGPLLLPFIFQYKLGNIPPIAILILMCGAGAPYMIIATAGLTFTPASHFGAITPSCMLVCHVPVAYGSLKAATNLSLKVYGRCPYLSANQDMR